MDQSKETLYLIDLNKPDIIQLRVPKMDNSQFDPNTFLDATTTEAAVKRPNLPAGDYKGIIRDDLSIKTGQQKKDPTKSWTSLNVSIEIDLSQYPDARNVVGQDKVVLFDSIMLNTVNGAIDNSPGANSKLRRYREALDMNTAGQPFAPRMMQGRPVLVKVKQEPYEGELQDRIDSVSRPV